MNLILLTKDDFIKKLSTVELMGRRAEHIRQVLRLAVGNSLKIGMINGKIGVGKIAEIDPKSVKIKCSLTKNPPKPLGARLIIALPRPPMIKRILFTASSMGVKEIYFINSSRVEKSFWNSSALAKESMDEQLSLGLEQSGDTIMPRVFLRPRFKIFVEDELPQLSAKTKKYLAHPSETNIKGLELISTPATLVIGPEGGFIPYEVKKFNDLGFKNISLGKRILRVETAVAVLLGRCPLD